MTPGTARRPLRARRRGPPDARSALPQGSDPVELDPADFTTEIDNPYWPISRGKRWVYTSEDERIVVTRTNRKKTVEGIDAVVLTDIVTQRNGGGDYVEVTKDWYAQDADGNVWYLGEDTKEYENGRVASTAGSWEHGVDGAYAGIIVPADPKPGLEYRQEYYKGEAEDVAKVLSLDATAKVPFGTFENCLEDRGHDAARARRRASTSTTRGTSARCSARTPRAAGVRSWSASPRSRGRAATASPSRPMA